MAHYLPVLLVSVTTTNTVPDDSSLSTLPRGQVDYLSHDWCEEDVWHSWRKMTRQKKEIANGLRLENASWRTWWKQRNKLKTVTPETLNWLKDSDVTWLYGPLHTAIDWAPPAKPQPKTEDPAEVAPNQTNQPRHKPILKYRSICELLTSELPTSPVLSSPESDEEGQQLPIEAQGVSNVSVPEEKSTSSKAPHPKRSALVHTKSDTHITRWGPNRAFRKDSPPRVDPPGVTSGGIATSQSKSSVDVYFSQSQVRSSYSQDSNSSTGTSTTGFGRRRSSRTTQKKKHISFNTFVEQCIAIDKPNNEDDTQRLLGARKWDYDDGYEEDEEDNNEEEEEVWDGRTRHHHLSGSAIAGSDSDSGDEDKAEDAEDDDDVLEIRPRSYSHVKSKPRKQRAPRSPSTSASISTPSSRSASASSPSRSISPSSSSRSAVLSTQPETRRRRSSTTSAYRPRPRLPSSHYSSFRIRARNGNEHNPRHPRNKHSTHVHVTIAPIAPTILKTTDSGYDGWAESFGDDGGSDDGLWEGRCNEGDERDKGSAQDDETTPVELVYVPPQFIDRYSVGFEIGTEEEDFDVEERNEERKEDESAPRFTTSKVIDDSPFTKDPEIGRSDSSAASTITPPSPIPTVIIEPLPIPSQGTQAPDGTENGLLDRLGEQDIQESLSRQPSSPKDISRSRSRSYSRSRTPSPAVEVPSSDTPHIVAPVPVPVRRMSSSVSPPGAPLSSSLLCPPVQRGRSLSYQDLPGRGQQQRGRSNTRTPPSYSDRERQGSGESPMGSLSPDSSFVRVTSIVGGVYANGRTDRERQKEKERREDKEQYRDRERDRERGRDKERGRDRAGKRPSQSLSPDFEMGIVMEGRNTTNGGHDVVITQSSTTINPLEVAKSSHIPYTEQGSRKASEDEEVQRRKTQPTPSNSPVLTMKVPPAGRVASVDTTFQAPSQHRSPQTQPHSLNNTFSVSTSLRQRSNTQSPVNSHSSTMNSPSNSNVRSPMKGKAPLLVPSPHPVEPSTSLSISPPGANEPLSQQPQNPGSPITKEPTIVEKAVGIVSSAGAFLGLWHS